MTMTPARKFARQLLGALVLVTAIAFLGVALEHSSLSNVVAPHGSGPRDLLRTVNGGRVVVTGPHGQHRTVLPPGFHLVRGSESGRGSGSPLVLDNWTLVVQNLGLVAAVAVVIVILDQFRRVARRRRRSRSSAAPTFVPG